jgi:hypothetical protein
LEKKKKNKTQTKCVAEAYQRGGVLVEHLLDLLELLLLEYDVLL